MEITVFMWSEIGVTLGRSLISPVGGVCSLLAWFLRSDVTPKSGDVAYGILACIGLCMCTVWVGTQHGSQWYRVELRLSWVNGAECMTSWSCAHTHSSLLIYWLNTDYWRPDDRLLIVGPMLGFWCIPPAYLMLLIPGKRIMASHDGFTLWPDYYNWINSSQNQH